MLRGSTIRIRLSALQQPIIKTTFAPTLRTSARSFTTTDIALCAPPGTPNGKTMSVAVRYRGRGIARLIFIRRTTSADGTNAPLLRMNNSS